jgi:hypothetical protein
MYEAKITGQCCCNCQYQRETRCYPANKKIGKGDISEVMGYVCLAMISEEEKYPIAIFTESRHGICEMHKAINFDV